MPHPPHWEHSSRRREEEAVAMGLPMEAERLGLAFLVKPPVAGSGFSIWTTASRTTPPLSSTHRTYRSGTVQIAEHKVWPRNILMKQCRGCLPMPSPLIPCLLGKESLCLLQTLYARPTLTRRRPSPRRWISHSFSHNFFNQIRLNIFVGEKKCKYQIKLKIMCTWVSINIQCTLYRSRFLPHAIICNR